MKIEATGDKDSSPFRLLPDEIVLEILNKVIDLKTLCICYAVCKRFSSIVVQIGNISFSAPPTAFDFDDDISDAAEACSSWDSFSSAVNSMYKFRGLNSLSINLSFPTQQQFVVNNRCRFKWKVKLGNNRLDSFLLLSPKSIYTNGNENGQERVPGIEMKILLIALDCLRDAQLRSSLLLYFITDFPLLEKVSITDSGKLGTVSMSGGKIAEMRTWLLSDSETIEQKLKQYTEKLNMVLYCSYPLLELPVSRYVMKGVTLYLMQQDDFPDEHDSLLDFVEDVDVLEDNEEEVVYKEALTEILKKLKRMRVTV